MKARGILRKEDGKYIPFSGFFSKLLERHLDIERSKSTYVKVKEEVKDIVGIAKDAKDIVT